jgi:EAL domain-containing protein (putative c-di-GMP-specific phosphodiesterase class I)/FixJ family two-component response regulator
MAKNKITVLIVDDTQYNLLLLSVMLSNQGYEVLSTTNGMSAIDLAITHQPNLILLDIKMPEMDGYEVCTKLKNNFLTKEIPIIFISAIDNVAEKIEAFAVGGIDFIHKPFHLVELLARVETHLRISSLRSQLIEQTKLLESQNVNLQKEISHLIGFNWDLYNQLQKAITQEQLLLFYQPIVSLENGLINGFEALIRWQHPERGIVNPVEFIDIVETTDLIYSIGQWVIENACKKLQIWQKSSSKYADLTMSINVSTKQLSQFDFVDHICIVLNKYEIAPHCLKIEITENTMIGDRDQTLETVCKLKELGIQFCIDDFGTGYSSLRRLTDFPIDVLKIDRSFIANEEWIVVKAIGSLAFSLGKTIVVEGIETASELAVIRDLFSNSLAKCYGQGYLFSKPLNPNFALELLINSQAFMVQ